MYVKVWAVICCLFVIIELTTTLEVENLILGGDEAEENSHPYMASLQNYTNDDWKHFCGAVLIAANKLVTAAHCVFTKSRKTRIKIGTNDLDEEGTDNKYTQTRTVGKTIYHPKYKQGGERNDIGVIYLTEPVKLNDNVKVAKITPKGSNFDGEKCVIAGWGSSEEFERQASPYLREAFIKVIPTAKCATFGWDRPITKKDICLFDEKTDPEYRARTCNGDSGGAVMCGVNYRYLAGVTSGGGPACTGFKPSISTRVSEYIDWINSV